MHLHVRIVAFDIAHLSFFLFSSVKNDPDFFIARVGEPLHAFHKTALRGFLPPFRAVAANQYACVQDVEAINDEKRGLGVVVLIHPIALLLLQVSSL
jgi:hypothetical protein